LYDEFQYKAVLKHNRDAIVDVLRLHKRHANHQDDRYEEEEEYVGEEPPEQNGLNNEVDIHGGNMQSPDQNLPSYIDPLSESEDEGDELVKEARRITRENRRKEKEKKAMERQKRKEEEEKRRERERFNPDKEARRRLKRFPVSNASSHPERSITTVSLF
jgi:hypothetical protein